MSWPVGFIPSNMPRGLRKANLEKQKIDAQSEVEFLVTTENGVKTFEHPDTHEKISYKVETEIKALVAPKGVDLCAESQEKKFEWVTVSDVKAIDQLNETHVVLEYKTQVKPEEVTSVDDANILISLLPYKTKDGLSIHAPLFDLDFAHSYNEEYLTVLDPNVNTNSVCEYLTDIGLTSSYTSLSKYDRRIYFDFEYVYVPSSTPGHGHLYIDEEVDQPTFFGLLEFMSECNWIEKGYYEASKARGYSAVRLPWIKKEI